MLKKPSDGGLRNTIYEKQTRSSRRLTPLRRMLYGLLVPLALSLVRLVWGWTRVVAVAGDEHIRIALERAPSFIPVYWHQQTLFCVRHLLARRGQGMKLGFLISPSVDGEIGALLVKRLRGHVIRGSSSHTGARALRDYYQALMKEDVSPAITPDGPRGPPLKFKPGAVLLAQLSQRPMIPMAYAASRAWRVKWDRFVVPWPGAAVAIVVGEPVYVRKGLNTADLERLQGDMEQRLNDLQRQAETALTA